MARSEGVSQEALSAPLAGAVEAGIEIVGEDDIRSPVARAVIACVGWRGACRRSR